jgi:RES domain-containing protein
VRLWRISDFADLNGEGGRLAPARWNSTGRPLVYLSEHPALALLEALVHIEADPDDLPDAYRLIEAEAPDTIAADTIDPAELARTAPDWRSDLATTRALGDAWLSARPTALLRVPSAILPKSTNILLNPAHADAAGVRMVEIIRPAYDRRLFMTQ